MLLDINNSSQAFFNRVGPMKSAFQELIKEFHASTLPQPYKRAIYVPEFSEHVKKALVFIGMRRSGKTWTMYQIMQSLIARGLDMSKILYINFEDERLCDMKKEHFQDILDAYFELYPTYRNRSDVHFFFDEIHEVQGWEKFIRRLLDQRTVQVCITGSSSKLLGKEIASSLRGRTFVQEIFPFSFAEVLKRANVSYENPLGANVKPHVMHQVRKYLQWGGFPEAFDIPAKLHRILLQGYADTVLCRDIIERHNIRNTQALKHLLTHCFRNSATLFSLSKMQSSLTNLGSDVSRQTLRDFLNYFEDAYCVFSLSKFDSSQSIKKVYAVDQGLITAVTLTSKYDVACQLETAVFGHLRRRSSDLFYYKTKLGKEVDFVELATHEQPRLYQVSYSIQNMRTREREISALEEAMQEFDLKDGTIVTFDEEDSIRVVAGTIKVIPVWKFLLYLT